MPHPFPAPPPDQRGELHRVQHSSLLLKGNCWNDPAERDLYVYTPPQYKDLGPIPCLLVLPAFAGSAEGLMARGLSDISIATRFDQLIASGCKPFIGVIPDTMTTVGGSQYVDSPAIGKYSSYIAKEIVPYVNEHFKASGSWASVGRSSGGYGSLRLAMAYPGLFTAVGTLAGDVGFDLCYLGDIPRALSGVRDAGGIAKFLDVFWAKKRPNGDDFAAFNIIAMSCAYTPDPAIQPIPARFPLDFETGQVHFDVLQEWMKHDPLTLIEDQAAQRALSSLNCLFIDAGDRDEYNLQVGARRLSARLSSLGIAHTYDEFSGGHRGTSYRYDTAIPILIDASS